MTAQLKSLQDSAALLDTKVGEMGAGLSGVSAYNPKLVALASALKSAYPGDATIDNLIAAVQGQKAIADQLVSGSTQLKALSSGVSGGAGDFYTAFSTTFAGSAQQLGDSSGQLYVSCLELLSGAQSLDHGCAELTGAVRELSGGADGLSDGAAEIVKKLPAMADGIDDMISGVEGLKDGIAELSDDGLKELKGKFDGLEGYLDKLSKKAAGYGSFMDERNAEISTVQFVLKTEGIGQEG
jgi:putative membrane protein